MRLPALPRMLAVAAAVALTGGIAASAVSVPGAVGTAQAAECKSVASDTKKDSSTVGATHNYTKSVPTTAGAGSKVTYTVQVGTSGIGNPYVHSIIDIPPAGLGKPTAKVRAYHVGFGLKNESVPVTAAPGGTWKVANAGGWFVNSSNPVTATFTYDLPVKFPLTKVTSGGIEVTGTVGVGAELPELKVCTTVRPPNPVEGAGSVADGLGVGSSEGSVQDATSDIISQIVKGVIGGAFGS